MIKFQLILKKLNYKPISFYNDKKINLFIIIIIKHGPKFFHKLKLKNKKFNHKFAKINSLIKNLPKNGMTIFS